MKFSPSLSITRSLLFTYCIENIDDVEREAFIVSKNINDDKELSELFDKLTKPVFLSYKIDERQWHIDTLQHFLKVNDSFDSVFYLFDTYFDDEIVDQRQFMRILLGCLIRYHAEDMQNESKN
ncbi:hypothetical protein HKK55_13945 [Pseudomonas sp. ADAK18]|uniref:hypothetical protein n=1 Tax=Pseudomonas sp. ADAK18 TaxID=2730848 RepID=UPI001462FA81|nr:hypothetical protein [Pseudomonas sp. ADAK18]QJI29770.1 hypothetical protein HKK55_13945 [Pseudomonas sp. ADAK18]